MEADNLRLVLAQNIKARRKELGITQVKLAELADISEPYMNDIERCQTWVSDKTLVKLAKSLHIAVADLFLLPDTQPASPQAQDSLKSRYITFQQKKKELLKLLDKNMESLFQI